MVTTARPELSGSTEKPKPGEIWWVAGQGPLRVVELPEPGKTSVTMENGAGSLYWASLTQLTRQATPEELETYSTNCKSRDVPFTPFG